MTTNMSWISALVILVGIVHVYSQCVSEDFCLKQPDLTPITSFGLDITRQLSTQSPGSNVFLSPLVLWRSLGFAYLGTEGKTKSQLGDALGITDKPSACELLRFANPKKINNCNDWASVNRIYFDESANFNPIGKDMVPVNFQEAVEAINGYVYDSTMGYITEVVQPVHVAGANTVMVSAAYFNGLWKNRFRLQLNPLRPFTNDEGTTYVTMMSLTGDFKNSESINLDAKVLALPYVGEDTYMVLLLPNTDIETTIANLNKIDFLDSICNTNMSTSPVDILLPKFKLEHKLDAKLLKEALKANGVQDLFDSQKADLSCFSTQTTLHISNITHKVATEIKEEGDVALTGTAFVLSEDGPSYNEFYFDRPFVFIVYDTQMDVALLTGVVYEVPGQLM